MRHGARAKDVEQHVLQRRQLRHARPGVALKDEERRTVARALARVLLLLILLRLLLRAAAAAAAAAALPRHAEVDQAQLELVQDVPVKGAALGFK